MSVCGGGRGANTSFRLVLYCTFKKRGNSSILCSLLPSSFPCPTHLSMKDTVLPQGIVCLAVVPATAIWVQGREGDPPPLNCCQASQLAPSLITSPEGTSSFFSPSPSFLCCYSHSLPPTSLSFFLMTAVFMGKAVVLIRKVRLLLTDCLTSPLCKKQTDGWKHKLKESSSRPEFVLICFVLK